MTMMLPVLCLACAHLDRTPEPDDDIGSVLVPVRCAAYPDGIPDGIAGMGDDHRSPRGDEHDGLIFEQLDTDEGHTAFQDWLGLGVGS